MPIILETWEAEIRRLMVPGQISKKFARPHLKGEQLGFGVHACHPSSNRRHEIVFQTSLGKKRELISEITREKRAGGVA
jgi:hypothetical protein